MASTTAILGPKGRLVIPVALRRALGITEGSELILLADGPGRLTLTTRAALHTEVWTAAGPAAGDAASELTAVRAAQATGDAATSHGAMGQSR